MIIDIHDKFLESNYMILSLLAYSNVWTINNLFYKIAKK